MVRRVGTIAAATVVACVLVAGLVAVAIRTSVPNVIVVGLVSGVLGSAATAVATLLAVRWTMEGQRKLDREAREFERHASAVDRQRAAFRQLLVGSNHVHDAARELRMYPMGHPPTDPDQKNYDPFAAVNASLGGADAAYRAAEPDLMLDLGPEAERVLKTYEELQGNFHAFWGLIGTHPLPAKQLEITYAAIVGGCAKLRAETHLALPKPGTEDWPELPLDPNDPVGP
jgi:hypothetical protein